MRCILLFIAVSLVLLGPACASAEKSLIIGALIPETGDDTSLGPGIEAAVDLAVSDLNASYSKAGLNMTVTVIKARVDGTKERAVNATEDLISKGAQIIVGPASSEEVSGILPILTRENIISVNPTSSLALSKPGDPVIRLCPDDAELLQAVSVYESTLPEYKSMKAIILSREDLYGDVLSEAIKKCPFVVDELFYNPGMENFTAVLDELNAKVISLQKDVGYKNVIIFAIGFDELADLMAEASSYPELAKVRWQGMDSVALNAAIIENTAASEFANATGLIALQYNIAQPEDSDYWRVYDAVKGASKHEKPSIYEILPYDQTLMAAWIMQNNPATLEEKLYLADNYGQYSYAATGWLKLNGNGDRKYGDYYFYQIEKADNGTYSWVPKLVYLSETNSILPLDSVNNTFMEHYR